MTTTILTDHFVSFLGKDVTVSFDNAENPREVILYRHDPLSDEFVSAAIQALIAERPDSLESIEGVLVSYEDRLGTTRRRIHLPVAGEQSAA